MNEIFIPYNTPSSKNSKIATSKGIFHSKTVTKYLRKLGIQHFSPSKKVVKDYKTRENIFRCIFEDEGWIKPSECIILGFHFVRGTKHKWDFHNLVQLPLDLLTAHDFIEDDNMDWIIPIPYKKDNKWYSYSKEYPGVYIKILK